MDPIFAVVFLLGIAAVSGAFSVSILGSKFIESVARQPEQLPTLRTQLFIILGLLDAIPMIGVGISLYILFVVI